MKSLKFLQKPEVLYLLIGLAVIIILAVVYFRRGKRTEGFLEDTSAQQRQQQESAGDMLRREAENSGLSTDPTQINVSEYGKSNIGGTGRYPLGQDRIDAGDTAMRRYNDFADTQDMERANIIPEMEDGDKMLNALLDTPSYEPDARKGGRDQVQGLNYFDERKYRAPPQVPILLQRIKMCERVTDWNCTKLSDPEFAQYCGICSKNGSDHLGAAHIGGMYIDPQDRERTLAAAERAGTAPNYRPTFGICNGQFLLTRPLCDVEKDRDECKNSTSLTNPNTASKCGFCGTTGNFVYVGSRGDRSTDYALNGNPLKYTARLRLGISDPTNATITITRLADGSTLRGSYSPNAPNVYILDIPNTFENERLSISVRYPDWQDYQFTEEENTRVRELSAPPRAPLVRATYGPYTGDYTTDDPAAKDVTGYIQSKFNITDCSNTNVRANSADLGGDPTPGTGKQLRMAFSNDGSTFAYAYGRENAITQPIVDDNFKTLCPTSISVDAAKQEVCEVLPGGTNTPTGRIYTRQFTQFFGSTGRSNCLAPTDKPPRGMVGIWDSIEQTSRTVPLDLSIRQLNGLDVQIDGVPKYGTVAGSRQFIKTAPVNKLVPIPPYLFWFWGTDRNATRCTIMVEVPALLRDPSVPADLSRCPSGPISTTDSGSKNLQAGVCEKFVNGQPQGPGTYTEDCIRSLYVVAGCTSSGNAYPNSQAKLDIVRKDADGRFLDADGIMANVAETFYNPASTGLDSNGRELNIDIYAKASMDCFGRFVSNVCDTPFKETGPLTPACLDYLFKNAGKDNPTIGSTYPNVYNRSSGTDRTAWTPIMYCQRTGTMAPIGADGKPNMAAIQAANAKGGVAAVRDFYKQIHYDANFNMDRYQQKLNLEKCYGVDVREAAKPCPPLPPRLQDIGPPNAGSVQNPNLIPNIGGPAWGQGLVSATVMPNDIRVGRTYTVGTSPQITFTAVDAGFYNNEQAYGLGGVVKTSDGSLYMNLAWNRDKRGAAYGGSFRSPPHPGSNVWMRIPPPPIDLTLEKVVLYTQCNYGGKATELPIGEYPHRELRLQGYENDTCKSVKVPPGLKVVLWEHDINQGWELTLTESNPCLQGGYANNLTSCRVSLA